MKNTQHKEHKSSNVKAQRGQASEKEIEKRLFKLV